MSSKILKNPLCANFGVGNTFSKIIFKEIGLNSRKNEVFLKKEHKRKVDNFLKKNLLGKDLRSQMIECLEFRKKIKIYKSSVLNPKNKIDGKKKIKIKKNN